MPGEITWERDASGIFKSHALSNELLKESAKNFRFVPFTKKLEGYGKGQGDTLTVESVSNLDVPANNGELAEDVRIPIDKFTLSSRSFTIKEWGRGVQRSKLMDLLSKFDMKQTAQQVLVTQLANCMDNAAASAFRLAKVCYIPTGIASGTWDVDGTPSASATVNMSAAHMGIIRDYMVNDLHVPFFEGNDFMGLFTVKALRGLKNDKAFEAWAQYLRDGDVFYKSELGRVEGIRMVEIAQSGALSNGVGTGSVLGEGIVFGAEGVGRIEIEYPHLRLDPNFGGDFGRMQAVVWYGQVAFGLYWDTANDGEAKVVRITSA